MFPKEDRVWGKVSTWIEMGEGFIDVERDGWIQWNLFHMILKPHATKFQKKKSKFFLEI